VRSSRGPEPRRPRRPAGRQHPCGREVRRPGRRGSHDAVKGLRARRHVSGVIDLVMRSLQLLIGVSAERPDGGGPLAREPCPLSSGARESGEQRSGSPARRDRSTVMDAVLARQIARPVVTPHAESVAVANAGAACCRCSSVRAAQRSGGVHRSFRVDGTRHPAARPIPCRENWMGGGAISATSGGTRGTPRRGDRGA
jgi:hypothetical protein